MNNGILTQSAQPVAMPYGLLGWPTPVAMPDQAYAYDTDASDYIRRVEAADGQQLELTVRVAIDAFVRGCKADGIWNAIKASCILAGARTLTGALVPLVGSAPTSINFVSGDYNRKTGLVGNGTSKYLNTNRSGISDPQGNKHSSVYASEIGASNTVHIGYRISSQPVFNYVFPGVDTWRYSCDSTASSSSAAGITLTNNKFAGVRKNTSGTVDSRFNNANYSATLTDATPASLNQFVFALNDNGTPAVYATARLAFYSIGESLSLALLDARVTTLINAIAAAIP